MFVSFWRTEDSVKISKPFRLFTFFFIFLSELVSMNSFSYSIKKSYFSLIQGLPYGAFTNQGANTGWCALCKLPNKRTNKDGLERVERLISTLMDDVGETQVIKALGFRNSATKFRITDEIKRQFQEYQRWFQMSAKNHSQTCSQGKLRNLSDWR